MLCNHYSGHNFLSKENTLKTLSQLLLDITLTKTDQPNCDAHDRHHNHDDRLYSSFHFILQEKNILNAWFGFKYNIQKQREGIAVYLKSILTPYVTDQTLVRPDKSIIQYSGHITVTVQMAEATILKIYRRVRMQPTNKRESPISKLSLSRNKPKVNVKVSF